MREGDEVYIQITGTYVKPKFSEGYSIDSTSTWKRKECISYDDRFPNRQPKGLSCYWINLKGSCTSLFKDYQGKIKDKIVFSDSSNGAKISYFIGNQEFLLGNSSSNNINILETKILVTKDLINHSSSFSIKAYPDEVSETTKTGFLGYASCAGSGQHHFNPNVSTNSQSISNTRTYSYIVTVRVKYLE